MKLRKINNHYYVIDFDKQIRHVPDKINNITLEDGKVLYIDGAIILNLTGTPDKTCYKVLYSTDPSLNLPLILLEECNAILELNKDKLYTKEDMETAISKTLFIYNNKGGSITAKNVITEVIQSLHPEEIEVEFVMRKNSDTGNNVLEWEEPKTTTINGNTYYHLKKK